MPRLHQGRLMIFLIPDVLQSCLLRTINATVTQCLLRLVLCLEITQPVVCNRSHGRKLTRRAYSVAILKYAPQYPPLTILHYP